MRYEQNAMRVPMTAPARMSYQLWYSSMVSAPPIRHAPRRGATVAISFHMAGVEIEGQEDEASKGGGGVTRRHRLETVVDLVLVTCADAAVEHDLAVAVGNVAVYAAIDAIVCCAHAETVGDDRLAHGEEVRAQTTDEPLDEDLEDGGDDERIEQTYGGVVDVPEAAGTDLHNQEDNEGYEESQQSSSPDGHNFVPEGVGELGVDNLAVLECD
jgi:hypothetical protein